MRMATSGTDRQLHGSQSGFTLVELLAVMAILAISIASLTYGSRAGLDSARVRAMLLETQTAIAESRTNAIRLAQERVFRIDLAARRLSSDSGKLVIDVPDVVRLSATVAEAEQYNDGSAGIRFYPAGTSSGGVLQFIHGDTTYEVKVNWLTGHVTLDRG